MWEQLRNGPQRILVLTQHWHSESDTLLINAVY